MTTLANNNTHPITTEAYVGWPTAGQADTIGANLDRVRVHAYVSDPNTAFDYSKNRLIDFANGNPGLDISILFSSEATFMQNWLENNSMLSAENIYRTDWINGSSGWSNNINLEGFTYFTYTDMTNVSLPVELSYFKGQRIDNSIQLNWETLSEINSDYFELERQDILTNQFNTLGRITSAGNSTSNIQYQFMDSNPNSGLNYYRLKQFDQDGSAKYSNTIAVFYQDQKTKIYPSITRDIIYLESVKNLAQVSIYDTNGQKIKEINSIESTITQINVKDLISGVYLLVLKSELRPETFRFIKQD